MRALSGWKCAAVLASAIVTGAACRSAGTPPPTIPQSTSAPSGASAPRTVQPGAPGMPSREHTARPSTAPMHTAADAAFMQGMIGHHAQAIEMVALLKTRTASQDMQLLGLRIEVSQNDEIKLMQTWLRERGESVPSEHAHHMAGAKLMPGMLTKEQMSRLSASKGTEFDRLFLELMIQHHEGALTMVKELMASPGAGQESNLYAFVADVEADQSAEITRMRRMRAALGRDN
jgi:uncharacterized protein (DUF305 family)